MDNVVPYTHIKAQLKSNFDPTFILSLKKKKKKLMWKRERVFN